MKVTRREILSAFFAAPLVKHVPAPETMQKQITRIFGVPAHLIGPGNLALRDDDPRWYTSQSEAVKEMMRNLKT